MMLMHFSSVPVPQRWLLRQCSIVLSEMSMPQHWPEHDVLRTSIVCNRILYINFECWNEHKFIQWLRWVCIFHGNYIHYCSHKWEYETVAINLFFPLKSTENSASNVCFGGISHQNHSCRLLSFANLWANVFHKCNAFWYVPVCKWTFLDRT